MGCGHDRWVWYPALTRWGDHDDAFDASNPCRNGVHQNGAGIGRPTAWNVNPSPLHGPPAAAKLLPMGTDHGQVSRQLAAMKIENAAMGQFQGLAQLDGCGFPGGLQLAAVKPKGLGPHAVETFTEVEQGGITLEAHLFQDGVHCFFFLAPSATASAVGNRLQSGAGGLTIREAG